MLSFSNLFVIQWQIKQVYRGSGREIHISKKIYKALSIQSCCTNDVLKGYHISVILLLQCIWFDFCFTALQHILGHFEHGPLP